MFSALFGYIWFQILLCRSLLVKKPVPTYNLQFSTPWWHATYNSALHCDMLLTIQHSMWHVTYNSALHVTCYLQFSTPFWHSTYNSALHVTCYLQFSTPCDMLLTIQHSMWHVTYNSALHVTYNVGVAVAVKCCVGLRMHSRTWPPLWNRRMEAWTAYRIPPPPKNRPISYEIINAHRYKHNDVTNVLCFERKLHF
jgi:hypothetical protein